MALHVPSRCTYAQLPPKDQRSLSQTLLAVVMVPAPISPSQSPPPAGTVVHGAEEDVVRFEVLVDHPALAWVPPQATAYSTR